MGLARVPKPPTGAGQDTSDAASLDAETVEGFGREWAAFDQSKLFGSQYQQAFKAYFELVPFDRLPPEAEGFDLGSGSGRWPVGVAPRVVLLHCVDPSAEALAVARRRLSGTRTSVSTSHRSTRFRSKIRARTSAIRSESFTTRRTRCKRSRTASASSSRAPRCSSTSIRRWRIVRFWYRALWRASDTVRKGISRLPFGARKVITTGIAGLLYWPRARLAGLADAIGIDGDKLPLGGYWHYSFYSMRTDALDRLGTKLEHRFSRDEMERMMVKAGLKQVLFREGIPYWTACGIRSG